MNNPSLPPPRWTRVRGWLAAPRFPWAASAVVLALLLPSLGFGLRMDDRVHQILVLGDPRYPWMRAEPHRLFDFFTSRELLDHYRDHGLVAWFADPDCRIAFFRPFSSLLHWVEHRFWGEHPWAMHALSLGVYVALFTAALALYRRLFPRENRGIHAEAVGLALWLYATDHTHGIPVGWIAQRNSLLSSLFGLLAILAHDRWRRSEDRRAMLVAPPLLLLALFSAEAGVSTLGALVAHALTLERPGQRLRALAPSLLATMPWAILYASGGYGARGSGMYLDPLHHPLSAAPAMLLHFFVLLGTELGNPLTDVWPMAPAALQGATLALSLLLLLGFIVAASPLVRRSPEARFLALASAMSLLPACMTIPQSRLLIFTGVFQLALLARVAVGLLHREDPRTSLQHKAASWMVAYSTLGHALLSPLLIVATSRQMVDFENALGTLTVGLPDDSERRLRVIVPNAPNMAFVGYATLLAPVVGKHPPKNLTPLANGTREVTLTGVDERSFRLKSEGGFVHDVTDALLRSPSSTIPVGATFDLHELTITITHQDEQGRADEALVQFDRGLDDPTLAFRRWTREGLVPISPPRPGESLRIPPLSFLEAVVAASQGKGIRIP